MSKSPQTLTPHDWEEVRHHEIVIESWGLTSEISTDDFRASVYAVKFDFKPQTMPNYLGEVILLLGDGLEPLVLVRDKDRKLVPIPDLREGRSRPRPKMETIFVTVLGGVAEVDATTVPRGIDVEVIDIDTLKADGDYPARLSPKARAYAKDNDYL